MTDLEKDLAEQRRVSTDPNWPPKNMVPATYVDGRHARSTTTKRDILAACRRLMCDGNFRPRMEDVCGLARRSVRTGFDHFGTVDGLHAEALKDGVVRAQIMERALGVGWEFTVSEDNAARLLRAIVTGRLP